MVSRHCQHHEWLASGPWWNAQHRARLSAMSMEWAVGLLAKTVACRARTGAGSARFSSRFKWDNQRRLRYWGCKCQVWMGCWPLKDPSPGSTIFSDMISFFLGAAEEKKWSGCTIEVSEWFSLGFSAIFNHFFPAIFNHWDGKVLGLHQADLSWCPYVTCPGLHKSASIWWIKTSPMFCCHDWVTAI